MGTIWNIKKGMKIINKSSSNEYKIIYKKRARDELEKIYIYIKERLNETRIAQKTIDNIRNKISDLIYFPFAHKLLRKTKKIEYRKFIIKNYIIIYKINLKEKEVNILHIYNQKQKIKNKKIYIKV